MENQQEPQRTPLEISSLSKLQREYPAIRSLKNDVPIEQALAYCCVLVGLNKDRYPVKLEKKVLVDFVKEKYPSYVAPEIVNAFKMALNREFGELDVNHYQTFSVEYFARIMTAYNEDRKNKVKEIQNKKITYSEQPIDLLDYYTRNLFEPYEKFCTDGVYPFSELNGWILFDDLKNYFPELMGDKETRIAIGQQARLITPKKKREKVHEPEETIEEHNRRILKVAHAMMFKRWIEEQSFNETNLREIITILIRK